MPVSFSHFISWRHFIIACHHRKDEYSIRQYFDRERKRDRIHITFIPVNCYSCSILLLVIVVYLLLCLIYKLSFIIGVFVWLSSIDYWDLNCLLTSKFTMERAEPKETEAQRNYYICFTLDPDYLGFKLAL